jgi:hypothetical protein
MMHGLAPEVGFSMSSVMVLKVWVGGCVWSEARCGLSLGCGIARVIFELGIRWVPNVGIDGRRLSISNTEV